MEWVEVPVGLSATLRCRSSIGRQGVLLGGGFVDPGFRGQLTLALSNLGPEDVRLATGDRCVQIVFAEVMANSQPYRGQYQESQGAVGPRHDQDRA